MALWIHIVNASSSNYHKKAILAKISKIKSYRYPTQVKYRHTPEKYWNRQQRANAGTVILLNSRSRNEKCQGLNSESGSQAKNTAWLGTGIVTQLMEEEKLKKKKKR